MSIEMLTTIAGQQGPSPSASRSAASRYAASRADRLATIITVTTESADRLIIDASLD